MKTQFSPSYLLALTRLLFFIVGSLQTLPVQAKNYFADNSEEGCMSHFNLNVPAIIPAPMTCTLTPPPTTIVSVATGQCGAIVFFPPVMASQDCGPVTETPPNGSYFPVGNHTVTATDGTTTVTFQVWVVDQEPPIVTGPADMVINLAPHECGRVVNYSVTASDNCAPGTIVQTSGLPTGSTFPVGTTTSCFETSDPSGNNGSYCFDVTVHANPNPDPAPDCTISGNTQICPGGSTQLCAPAGHASYQWTTGQTTTCITVNYTGYFGLQVTTPGRCRNTCTVQVTTPTQPDTDGDGIPDACDPTLSVCSSIDILLAMIQASNLSNGLKNALSAKLNAAKNSYQNGNNTPTINQLNAFINQVLAQSGNGIPTALANQWIASAQAIIAAIQNGNTNCTTSQGLIASNSNGNFMTATAENNHFKVAPNPVHDDLSITWQHQMPGAGSIQIMDLTGRQFHQEVLTMGQQSCQISVAELPTGLYLIQVVSEGKMLAVEKFVKQ